MVAGATQLGAQPGLSDEYDDMLAAGAIAAQLGVLPDQAPWPDSESHWSHIGDFHTWGLKGENHDHLVSEPAFEDKYRNYVPGRNDVSGYNTKPSLHKSVSNHYKNSSNKLLPRQSRYYRSDKYNASGNKPNNAVVPHYYPDKENAGPGVGYRGGNPGRPGPSNFFHSFPPVPLDAYVPPGGGKQQQSQQSPQYHQPPPSSTPPLSPQYHSQSPNQQNPATPQLFKHLPSQYNHNGQKQYDNYKPFHGNPQPPPPPQPPSHTYKRGIRPQTFNLPRSSYQQVNFPLRSPRDNGFVIVGGGPTARFPQQNFIPPGRQGGTGPAGKSSLVSGDPFLPGEKLEIEEDFTSFSHGSEPLLFDHPNSNYPPNSQQNNDFRFDNFDDTPHDFSFSLEDNKDFVTLEFGDDKPNSKELSKYETQDLGFENYSQENALQEDFDGEVNSEERFAKPVKEDNSSNFEKVPEEFMDFMKYKERYNSKKYSSEQNSGYENKRDGASNNYPPQQENIYDNYDEKSKPDLNKYAIDDNQDISQQNNERYNSQADYSEQEYGKRNIKSKDYISSQYGNKEFKEEIYNPPSYSSPPKTIPTERSPVKVTRLTPNYQHPRVQQSYREPINVHLYNKEDANPQFNKEENIEIESMDYSKNEPEIQPQNKYLSDYKQNKNAARDNTNNAPETNNEDDGNRNNLFNDFSDFSDLESEYEDGGFDDWLKSGDAKDSDFDFGDYGDDKPNDNSNQELKFLDNEADSRKRSDHYYDYDYYSNDEQRYQYTRHQRQPDNRRSMRVSQSKKYNTVKTPIEQIHGTKHITKNENEDRSPWIPILN